LLLQRHQLLLNRLLLLLHLHELHLHGLLLLLVQILLMTQGHLLVHGWGDAATACS
jgi:hypothetical protein